MSFTSQLLKESKVLYHQNYNKIAIGCFLSSLLLLSFYLYFHLFKALPSSTLIDFSKDKNFEDIKSNLIGELINRCELQAADTKIKQHLEKMISKLINLIAEAESNTINIYNNLTFQDRNTANLSSILSAQLNGILINDVFVNKIQKHLSHTIIFDWYIVDNELSITFIQGDRREFDISDKQVYFSNFERNYNNRFI